MSNKADISAQASTGHGNAERRAKTAGIVPTELTSFDAIVVLKEYQMTDNKKPNEKQPGEKPEGKYHYNPGNQSDKEAKTVPKEEAKKDD